MPTISSFERALRSRLVQVSMLVPVLLAVLASAQDLLPSLQSVLGPWVYFTASLVLSTVVSASHVIALQEKEEARDAAATKAATPPAAQAAPAPEPVAVPVAEPAAVPAANPSAEAAVATPVAAPAAVATEAAPVTTPAPTAPATGA